MECPDSESDIVPNVHLSQGQQLGVLSLKLFKHRSLVFVREPALRLVDQELTLADVLTNELELWRKGHVSDLRLKVAEDWLQ